MNPSSRFKIALSSALTIPLIWIILTIDHWGFGGSFRLLKGIGSLAGVAGYSLLALSLLLSSRWNGLEKWLGGLDQIYDFHRKIGILSFFCILLHPLILGLRKKPEQLFDYFLPFHQRLSMNLGVIAFWILIGLLTITWFKLLPYHRWKMSHKAMSVVFLLASLHFFLSNHLISPTIESKILLSIPFGIGLLSIIYKQILFYFKKTHLYRITATKILNPHTIEIFIEPEGKPLLFIPGQYAFFSFRSPHLTTESHPFTLCGEKDGSKLSILVKCRGDFTKNLFHRIKIGDLAEIEGPHGQFDFRRQGKSQIWIAGGIGIVPFLCWARLLNPEIEKSICLFYCFHAEEEAIYSEELGKISKKLDRFHYFPICTMKEGHLSVESIEKKVDTLQNQTIFMCGPKRMTEELSRQLIARGVQKEKIIFENFEFF